METIGIMAGSGNFPFLAARGAAASGCRVVICGFEGNADPALAAEASAFVMLPLGKLNALISFFKKQGVTKICMAGAIAKPKALDIKPDFRAAKLLFKLMRAKGDDKILRAVAEELESEGFAVVRPDSLAPSLKSESGVLGRKPTAEEWEDMAFGFRTAKAVGALDIGQCVVVRSGIVMAVEAIEGTDAALERGGSLGGAGCTAVKTVKPGQDERLDLPSIGLKTMEVLVKHQFCCLAYEAGRTLFFDRDETLRLADKHGITVVGLPENPEEFFRLHGVNKE